MSLTSELVRERSCGVSAQKWTATVKNLADETAGLAIPGLIRDAHKKMAGSHVSREGPPAIRVCLTEITCGVHLCRH